MKKTLKTAAIAISAGLIFTTSAIADEALKIIVGFPAGSSPDLTARIIAEPLAKELGQSVRVENKAGAGGNLGAAAVAKTRDSNTVGLVINSALTVAKLINPKTAYDPQKDLAPIALIGQAPLILVASKKVYKTDAKQLFKDVGQNADKWSYGSPGVGTLGHIGMEMLKNKMQLQTVHIPYMGYAQVAGDMLRGDLQISLLPPALAMAQEKAGNIKTVAITSAGKSELAPNLPTLNELGATGFDLQVFNALAAPASMPKEKIEKISKATQKVLQDPEVAKKLLSQGWQVSNIGLEEFKNRLEKETKELGEIIKTQKITNE